MAFAATHSKVALRSILSDSKRKMAKFSMYVKIAKKYKWTILAVVYIEVIRLVLVCFHCSVIRKTPGQVQIYQFFVSFAGFSTQY